MEKILDLMSKITNFTNEYGWATNIITVLIILVVGWVLSSLITRGVSKLLDRKNYDKTLKPFVVNLTLWLTRAIVFIVATSSGGIETTSLIALVGAVGFAIGMALQGSLGNLAGGVMLLVFRPVRVGDFIIAAGEAGVVEEIQLFHTVLVTPDGKTIYLPNGPLSSGNITNVSIKPERRVDITFGISYQDDIDKARKIINEIILNDNRILNEPAPAIPLINLGDSSVDLQARMWVKTEDFWNVKFEITEKVKKAFDANNVSIPFPQMDVHLQK